jgi:hypothetical protein
MIKKKWEWHYFLAMEIKFVSYTGVEISLLVSLLPLYTYFWDADVCSNEHTYRTVPLSVYISAQRWIAIRMAAGNGYSFQRTNSGCDFASLSV